MPTDTRRAATDGRQIQVGDVELDSGSQPNPPTPGTTGPRPGRRLAWLAVGVVVVATAFLTVGVRGDLAFALRLRASTLATMVVVAVAVATSTVAFQTITHNRILTPSIMGFDALYVLVQTMAVAVLGAAGVVALDGTAAFLGKVGLMVVVSGLLFRWLFLTQRRSVHLLVLVGVVLGVLLRSVSSLVQRVMDPNAFAVLQDTLFASFTGVDGDILALGAALVAVAGGLLWRLRRELDVVALGRDAAVSLGVDHRRLVATVLVLVAVLVAVSTALVGPVTFFGLLVANLAHHVGGSSRHEWVVPVAALLGVVTLVGGQAILQHVFGLTTTISVIIEFLGGLTLIWMLLRDARKGLA